VFGAIGVGKTPQPITPSRFFSNKWNGRQLFLIFGSHLPERKANAGHGLDQQFRTLA
jgi:hypothetical protein